MPRRPATDGRLLAVLHRDAASAPRELRDQDWAALVDAAARHGVVSLLWHRLQERGLAPDVPADVRQRIARTVTLDVLRAASRERQLAAILGVLRARGVPTVLLKGAYLASHVYPSPAARPMGDLDLLVPAQLLATAMDAGVAAGYARPSMEEWATFAGHRHPPPLRRPGRLNVELHVTIEPCRPPFTLSLRDVWARARPVATAGEQALALAPEDLLLQLATHMGHSHLLGTSLLRVYDVAAWVERFGGAADWDAVVRRAVASGGQRFVYVTLELASRLLGAGAPREVVHALRGEGDDTAVEHAAGLLGVSPELMAGALVLTWPSESRWTDAKRVGRSLLLTSELHRGARRSAIRALDHPSRRQRYRARALALARLLLRPATLRVGVRQVERVRYLLDWARGSAGTTVERTVGLADRSRPTIVRSA